MAGSTTPCLFCGNTGRKLTGEDVYPRWLRRAMNIQGDVTYSAWGKTVRTLPQLEMRVREVCEVCNNGWMHDLERAFRSVMFYPINGFGPATLTEPVQLVIALWAVKTWLLIERATGYLRGQTPIDPGPGPFRWMHDRKEPPPDAQVWIGAVDAREAKLISFVATQWVGSEDPPVGISGVFTIGCVLFFIYSPVEVASLPERQVFRLGISGGTGEHLRPIWPAQGSAMEWPPSRVFDAEQLEVVWPSGGRIHAAVPPT